jgi:DNA-directed RNA polymerase omega subunit
MDEKIPGQEEVETPVDSKFRLVLVAATRAEQLIRGARPKVEAGKRKPTKVAMEEVLSNLVDWGYGPAPQPEPLPEAEPTEEPAAEVH